MTNYNKVMSSKQMWAKLSKERNKYRTALLYIQKTAKEAETSKAVHLDALEAIRGMADSVLKEGDDCEFAA